MLPFRFQDCYALLEDDTLTIGNSRIERTFVWRHGDLMPMTLTDKASGDVWRLAAPTLPAELPLPGDEPSLHVTASLDDDGGLTDPHLRVIVTATSARQLAQTTYTIFPNAPFISLDRQRQCHPHHADASPAAVAADSAPTGIETATPQRPGGFTPPAGTTDVIPLGRKHLRLQSFRLHDRTDANNSLVTGEERFLYQNWSGHVPGSLFLVSDPLSGRAVLAVNDCPTMNCQLCAGRVSAYVKGNDLLALGAEPATPDGEVSPDGWRQAYGTTVGVGDAHTLLTEFRRLYRRQTRAGGHETFVMSNTWGDRNQDARVSDAFMLGEIQAAHDLGIDVVQIDDGWQKGVTANSKLAANGVWSGYYDNDPHFWEVHPQKFPRGLSPLAELARQLGVQLGLWFSPDSSHDFRHWRDDADTLLRLHRQFGIAQFKLDGINLQSKRGEANFLALLGAVATESHHAIRTNLDITAQSRLGYLYRRQFGTLFVENRYTDWQNYYPHTTLRNAWDLAHLLPLNRFQLEFLNNRRNADRYGDDPLAPATYSLDYEFAAVMLANPLAWMELSSLDPSQRDELRHVIAVYRRHRHDFAQADIHPLGDRPDGCAHTGFQAIAPRAGHLLLFREVTPEATTVLTLAEPLPPTAALTLEATNCHDVSFVLLDRSHLQLRVPRPRSWCLLSYSLI